MCLGRIVFLFLDFVLDLVKRVLEGSFLVVLGNKIFLVFVDCGIDMREFLWSFLLEVCRGSMD